MSCALKGLSAGIRTTGQLSRLSVSVTDSLKFPGYGTFTFWIRVSMFMIPSAYLWVYVRPGILGSYMDPLFDQFDVYVSKVTKEVLTLRYWKEFERKSSSQTWKAYSTSLLSTIGVALGKTVWALLVILFSLLFFSTTYLQPISSFMFISWDI
jgi:K+-transporting ATPase A subunit